MRRSIILTTTASGLTPVLLLVSLYVTFRGHNAPGGGFAGGLIMGTAIILRYLADGRPGIRSTRLDPVVLVAAGLGLSLITSTAPLVFGSQFMDSKLIDLDVPLIGEIHFVTAGFFDIGVHVLVVGVVMSILIAFARADDEAGTAGDDVGAAPAGGGAATPAGDGPATGTATGTSAGTSTGERP